jgi:hypothetical protein
MTREPDPLITQLRDQANAFDPDPPTALRRRLFEALAQASTPRPAHRSLKLGWTIATLAAAILIALAFWELRPQPRVTPFVQTPQSRPRALATSLSYPTGNPIALAQRWVEQPLQNQVNTLIEHLTSARDTLRSPFPSPVKRPHPDDAL